LLHYKQQFMVLKMGNLAK